MRRFKTATASTKSRPCFFRFDRRFRSSHSKRIIDYDHVLCSWSTPSSPSFFLRRRRGQSDNRHGGNAMDRVRQDHRILNEEVGAHQKVPRTQAVANPQDRWISAHASTGLRRRIFLLGDPPFVGAAPRRELGRRPTRYRRRGKSRRGRRSYRQARRANSPSVPRCGCRVRWASTLSSLNLRWFLRGCRLVPSGPTPPQRRGGLALAK